MRGAHGRLSMIRRGPGGAAHAVARELGQIVYRLLVEERPCEHR